MSEMAPEAPARGKKENVFTRKIGPLPMWAWVAIIGGAIIAFSFYKSKTSGAASSAADTGATTDASQVPQFVNQTYTSPGPPGPVGPTGGTGPPGPPGPPGKPPVPVPIVLPPRPGPKPPGGGGFRTEKLRYKGNLEQIAKRNHIDMEDLLEANPGLKRYAGTGHVFPVGTTIRVPPQAA